MGLELKVRGNSAPVLRAADQEGGARITPGGGDGPATRSRPDLQVQGFHNIVKVHNATEWFKIVEMVMFMLYMFTTI